MFQHGTFIKRASRQVLWLAAAAATGASIAAACAVSVLADDAVKASDTAQQIKANVRGRVVMQPDGKPVADAEVRLVTWSQGNTRYNVKKTRSDKNGEFAFDGVGAGKHRLVAFYEDFASRQSRYKGETVDLEAKEPVILKLQTMPRIAVHVVSKDGDKPIAGALVRLVWSDTEHDHRTDEKGDVLLRALTPEVWHVNVRAPGFAAKEDAVNLGVTEQANVKFELEPACVLFGTVKEEGGKLLAGAGVSVFPANFDGQQIEYVKTDAQGRFRFENLPLNRGYQLIVSKSGYVEVRPEIALGSEAGEEYEFNYVLKRATHGGSVRGTVTDTAGEPIAGATIANEGPSSRDVRREKTNERGEFLVDDVFERSLVGHELVVKAKGFAPQRVQFKPGTKEKPSEITVRMEPGHRIRGRVVDESGKPIAGVRIYHSDGNHSGNMEFGGESTTRADGTFEFDSLPAGAPFSFEADGYSELESTKLALDGDAQVTVTLQQEGVLRGKVIDAATKQPIKSFNVRITFSPDRQPGDPAHGLSGARATSRDGEHVSNPDGKFLLDDSLTGCHFK
jgi:protocatechuate 3,4-dioxygenase beta subunit